LTLGDRAFDDRQEKTLGNKARMVSVGGFDLRIETPKMSVLTVDPLRNREWDADRGHNVGENRQLSYISTTKLPEK
jgi:hypothetical protein